MAQDFSFDVVSRVDIQEVKNAVDQAMREVGTRYDFKGTVCSIDLDEEETLKLAADNEFKLKALIEVLESKLFKRGVSLKSLSYGKMEPASKGTVRQEVKILQGVETEKARKMVKLIKDMGLKVQTQIQGDQLRVSSKVKDQLQSVMQMLKQQDFGIDLQFVNYR
jgi:cyclic-di-GMP-binding protein